MIYMFNNRFSLLLVVFLVFFGANFGMYVEKPYINNEMWKKLIATFNYNITIAREQMEEWQYTLDLFIQITLKIIGSSFAVPCPVL